MATDNKKTPEQIAEERRSYVAGVMDPKTYGLTGAPLSTPGDVGEALTALRSRGVNLLGPECRVDFLPRHHLVSLRWMFFDRMLPEPATNRAGRSLGNGVWYPQAGGGYSLNWPSLNQMAGLCGVSWLSFERTDDGLTPLYWRFRGRAKIKFFDGGEHEAEGTGESDLRDGSAEVKLVEDAGQLGKMRAKGSQRAESIAKARIVRELLGLRQKFSEAEADMPFVWPTLVFCPPADPELDRLIAIRELGLTDMLYGPRSTPVRVLDVHPEPSPRQLTADAKPAPDFRAEAEKLARREVVPVAAAVVAVESRVVRSPAPPVTSRPPWEQDEPAARPLPAGPSDVAGFKLADVIDYVAAKDWGDWMKMPPERKKSVADYLTTPGGKADITTWLELAAHGGGR